MILHAIELNHVGPFRQHAVRVGPFSRALNIIAAENESGKSVAMNAAARALFDKHTTRDGEVRALKPAGTDLAPKISVEFETSAGRYRIEKTFLQSPRSTLSQWQNGTWQPVAEADAADQRVQTLLNSSLPGRGATNPAHWGFLGFLWARQGEPVQWPTLTDDTGQKIRHRLARVEIDPVIESLRDRLASIADAIITSTGQSRVGGQLKLAEDNVAAIHAELTELGQTRDQLGAQRKQYDSLTAEVSRLESELVEQQKRADDLAIQAKDAEIHRAELDGRQAELDTARDRLQAVSNDVESLAKHRSELAITLAAANKAAFDVQSANAQVEEVRRRTEITQQQIPGLESQRTRLRTERQRSQDLRKLLQQRTEAAQIGKIVKRVSSARSQISELQEKRVKLPEVTPAKLRRLEELSASILSVEAQVQALGLTVELTPDANSKVAVNEAGKTRRETIGGKQSKTLRSPQALDLRLEGWGRVFVRSGAKEARELTDDLTGKQDTLRKALLDVQAASLEAARDTASTRKDINDQIKVAETVLTNQLGDYESDEELQKAHSAATNRVAALEEGLHPTAAEHAMSATELEANDEKLGTSVNTVELSIAALGKQFEKLRSEDRTAVNSLQTQTKELNELGTDQRTLDARINDLVARYPTGLDVAKAQAQNHFVETEARLNSVKAKLPPDFEKLPERNRRAAAALQQLADDLQSKRAARDVTKGALETLGGQGLYSRETELLERREEAVKRRDAARARGLAARIAHDLIEMRKQAATKSVLAPLQKRLTAALAEITGHTERQVFLDENLQIAGLGPSGEQSYAFDQLSQGTKEQLLLCLRLAVAQELVAIEPQVLILDDVLVNTDALRQERVLDVLEAATTQLQIVILTCHPDRYRGVGQLLALTSS